MSAFDKVAAARSTKKLTSVDYINAMFGESFIELHGDRNYSDDKAVVIVIPADGPSFGTAPSGTCI